MSSSMIIKRAVTNCQDSTLKDRPITTSQWIVLTLVMERGEVNLKDIAKMLNISSSAATQLVDSLCKKAYLCRKNDTSDRRKTIVTLTKHHAKEMKQLRAAILERFMEVFHVLNNAELECLALLNEKVANCWKLVEEPS